MDIYDFAHDEGLIVLAADGREYSNQTGGVLCDHPVATGVWVPLAVPSRIKEVCYDSTYPDRETLDTVDHILAVFIPGARVDRDAPNQEAWVHLLLPQGGRAILTWENSD